MALTVIKPSGLDLSGNFSVTTLNASANLTAGNVLTDNLKYANGSPYVFGSGNAAGSNTQIQFNDANSFAGSANLTFNKSTNTLSVTNIVANGSGLTNLTGANVTGEVGLATFATTANAVAGANVTGVVANATYAVTAGSTEQSNIANIAYSVSASNISGIINLANFATTANAVAGANVTGQVGNALVAGTVYTNAQPNITSVGTLISLDVTGNAQFSGANVSLGSVGNLKITGGTANYVLQTDGTGNLSWVTQSGGGGGGSSISNGTSNVNIAAANGNITMGVNGTANAVVISNAEITISGNINSSGNITAPRFTSNVATGTSPFIVTSTTQVANLNSETAGTVITNAQPNITSVGTLTGLTSNGTVNFTNASNVSLGAVGNVKITGGSSGLFLTTDGVGNLNWAAPSVTELANGTSNIKIPTANGNVTFSVNGVSNILSISSDAVTLGNGSGGTITNLDLLIANYVQGTLNANSSAQPNITSVGSLTSLTVTGNAVISGNVTANTGIVTFGSNANVRITGGTSGHFLRTDGAGNLTWANGSIPVAVDNSTNATYFPVLSTVTTGIVTSATISNTKLQFNPSSGQLTVTDLNTTSDMTLKTDVQKIEDPMTTLRQLVGFGFNWKDNGRKSYGLMAQLLEKVLPELVSHNAQGLKTVNYLPLIAFLIEAVKRQQDDIEELKHNLSARKTRASKKDK